MSDIRVRVLGDTTNFKSSMSDVERIATATAGKIQHSFKEVGSFLKTTIGLTAVGVGMERAVESASQLVSLQKVQAQLIKNQKVQKDYALTGDKNAERWYSKRLDDMATELSLQNGINKASVVQAQTFILSNQDLVKMTSTMKDGMATVLQDAANIAEITGGNITSTSRMLTRMLANPSASMSSMRRMGFQLTQAEQDRIKALQKSGGLLKAQQLTIQYIGQHTKDIAKNAQSPVDLLKNEVNLVWQSLGMGLLPILENLAKALIEPIKALMPVLSFMATAIKDVAETLGKSLGDIFKSLVPLFTLMTNSIIPALLNIITPLIKMVEVVLTPLSKVFSDLVGTKDKLGPLAEIFVKIGEAINANLMKAVDGIAKTFTEMSNNGKLKELFDGLLQAFITMAPVLPELADAVAQLALAFAPLIVAALPDIVFLIKVFAKLLALATPLITTVITGATNLVKHLGPLKPFIAGLAAVWFTRRLFLTPIHMVTGMVTGLMGKMKALKEIMLMTKISTGGSLISRVAGVLAQRGGIGAKAGTFVMKAGAFGSKVAGVASSVASQAKPAIAKVALSAASMGASVVGKVAPMISKVGGLFARLGPLLLNPWVMVGIAVVALIIFIIKHWKGFVKVVTTLWHGVLAVFKFVWRLISAYFKFGIKVMMTEISILKKLFVGAWHLIYGAFKWVWDKISAGFNWLVNLFKGIWTTITNLGKSIWNGLVNGFIDAINTIIRLWNKATGWIPWLGGKVQINTFNHIGDNGKKPIKRHNGGMVPGLAGREVPAILQAGEAVLTANQMKGMNQRQGAVMNVHPNAVNITIHGNADAATTAEIKRHVEAQFKELHRTLKGMGR